MPAWPTCSRCDQPARTTIRAGTTPALAEHVDLACDAHHNTALAAARDYPYHEVRPTQDGDVATRQGSIFDLEGGS